MSRTCPVWALLIFASLLQQAGRAADPVAKPPEPVANADDEKLLGMLIRKPPALTLRSFYASARWAKPTAIALLT